MTKYELDMLEAEAEARQFESTSLFRKAKEERAQRSSFVQTVDNVMQTRGGTLAFTLVSPIAASIVEERGANTSYGYHDAAEGRGFHWRGGLYFRRDGSGAVVISDWRPFLTEDGEKKWTGRDIAVIDADSWASIVASVSAGGEVDGRWQQARDFHTASRGAASPAAAPPEREDT